MFTSLPAGRQRDASGLWSRPFCLIFMSGCRQRGWIVEPYAALAAGHLHHHLSRCSALPFVLQLALGSFGGGGGGRLL